MRVIEAEVGSPDRTAIEEFIAQRYMDSFGVRPPLFAPRLVAVLGRDDRIVAACGLRAVADGFFSEPYVDGTMEEAASRVLGRAIERRRLFEITTMAATSGAGMRRAVIAAIAFGRRMRCRACLFTATAELRVLLDRHGIVARPLAQARPELLAAADAWGAYYAHDPWVCIADQPPFESAMPRQRQRPVPAAIDSERLADVAAAGVRAVA